MTKTCTCGNFHGIRYAAETPLCGSAIFFFFAAHKFLVFVFFLSLMSYIQHTHTKEQVAERETLPVFSFSFFCFFFLSLAFTCGVL